MSKQSDEIAVVGAALRAPGAASLEQYWHNLAKGVESIRALNDDELLALGVSAGQLSRPQFVKAGAVLEGADLFDAAYFGFNRRQALVLDPQHRLMLELAVEAFEHAGCDPAQFSGDIGTYLAAASNGYGRRSERPGEPTETFLSFTSNDVDFVATRVAYKLGLTGPSISVQSACSSSLVAVHQACEALRNHEIDMALAGGVSLLLPQAGYVYHPDMILSRDGHCRAFDETAAGTVFGNGLGLVVLKRLDDALADGDRVLAVVKGSAVNNDGAGKVDYYAPSVEGQRQAINAALVAAGVHPDTIGCVEAHGTGTPLGDPIEIEALTQAYRAYTARSQFCAIGSVKTNIGHLNTAAGIAGFIKAVLMLDRGHIPPSLNFRSPNPRIDFAGSPFFVNDRLRPWPRGEAPRRAAVSAFGIGGTNAHVILEEAPARRAGGHELASPQLLILSAKTEAAVARQLENLLAWLNQHPDALLADVAYTLQVGRRALPWRLAFVGRSVEHVCGQSREQRPAPRRVGQERSAVPSHQLESVRGAGGSQRERLLEQLGAQWLEGATVDWADLHTGERRTPLSLPTYPFERERYWLEAVTGGAAPAAAPRRVGRMWFSTDAVLADHRLGGRPLVPGALYLELALEQVRPAGDERASIAVRNLAWPAPCFVDDKAQLAVELTDGAKRFRLSSDSTLHAHGELAFEPPTAPPAVDLAALRRRCPKRVAPASIYATAERHAFSFGPSFRTVAEVCLGTDELLASLQLPQGVAEYADARLLDGALHSVIAFYVDAEAATLQVPYAVAEVQVHRPLGRTCLVHVRRHASSTAQQAQYDIDLLDEAGQVLWRLVGYRARAFAAPAGASLLTARMAWTPQPLAVAVAKPASLCIVLPGAGHMLDDQALRGVGRLVRVAPGGGFQASGGDRYTLDTAQAGDWASLWATGSTPQQVLWLAEGGFDAGGDAVPDANALIRHVQRTAEAMASFVASLMQLKPVPSVRVLYAYRDTPANRLANDWLQSFFLSARKEHERIQCQAASYTSAMAPLERLLDELAVPPSAGVVRLDGPLRLTASWETFTPEVATPLLSPGMRVLITGGSGAIGRIVARHLVERHQARVVLLSRSAPAARDHDGGAGTAWLEQVVHVRADVADAVSLAEGVAEAVRHLGALDGVIHAAGVLRDGLLLQKKAEEIAQVLAPKVQGTVYLDQLTASQPLRFFALFSSVSAALGNAGQTDYSAASGFMDQFAIHRQAQVRAGRRTGHTVSIGWPLWAEGGMVPAQAALALLRAQLGLVPLPSAQALRAFEQLLSGGVTQATLAYGDAARLAPAFGLKDATRPQRRTDATSFQSWLRETIANAMALAPADVGLDESWDDLGLERTQLLSLADACRRHLAADVESSLLVRHRSVRQLAEALCPPPSITATPESSDDPAAPQLDEATLTLRTQVWLRGLFAKVTELSDKELGVDTHFEKFGLDSFVVMSLNQMLEPDFAGLSRTLFFEHQTMRELADYFVTEQRDTMLKVLSRQQDADTGETSPEAGLGQSAEGVPAGPDTAGLGADTQVDRPAAVPAAPLPITARHEAERSGDIAIVGISGRYPMADNLAEFWLNLREGRDCITEVPPERWNFEAYLAASSGGPATTHAKWGGWIRDADRFDPLFFGISPRDAEWLDPQARLFLQEVWAAVEDAGYAGRSLATGNRVGVFVGAMTNDFQLYGAEESLRGNFFAPNSSYWAIANRVSHFLNLHGPSIAIDTACSSSLTAIHLACQSLRDGDCETAIAGGVNLSPHYLKYLQLAHAGFLSTDGRCRSFGAGGDGYVPGEGVGAVVLKPLARALADGDNIHAVIKASAINHGGKTSGFSVPNPKAQADVISEALRRSGVDPRTMGYIEAHGTGTGLGDPIELTGLSKAFSRLVPDKGFCPIGSAKSNIGHLEAAAGIAGLTKLVLQMKHRTLVPSLHAEQTNPDLDFSRTPFVLQRFLAPWPESVTELDGHTIVHPRRAGLSSFGAGGSNSHLVLEEAPARESLQEPTRPLLFVFSALNAERLSELLQRFVEFLADEANVVSPVEVAYTLQAGRLAMSVRAAFVAATRVELLASLRALARQGDPLAAAPSGLRWAALGRQWVLGETIDWRAEWEALEPDLKPRCISLPTYPFARQRFWVPGQHPTPAQGPHVQARLGPLLDRQGTALDAGVHFYKTFHRHDAWIAAHVVGERCLVAGAMQLEMAAAAAAQLDCGRVARIDAVIWPAPAVVDAEPLTLNVRLDAEGDGVRFQVRGSAGDALHCQGVAHFVTEAAADQRLDLQAIAARCTQRVDVAELYAGYRGYGIRYGEDFQLLREVHHNERESLTQLAVPLARREQFVHYLLHPPLLDGVLQSVAPVLEARGLVAQGLWLPARLGRLELLQALTPDCRVHAQFKEIDAAGRCHFNVAVTDAGGRILLKLHDFTLQRALALQSAPALAPVVAAGQPHRGDEPPLSCFVTRWRPLAAPGGNPTAAPGDVLIVTPQTDFGLGEQLARQLPTSQVVRLGAHGGLATMEGWRSLLDSMPAPKTVFFLGGLWPAEHQVDDLDTLQLTQEHGAIACLLLLKALRARGGAPPRLAIVTNNLFPVDASEPVLPYAGSLVGLARVAANEWPQLQVTLIDVDQHDLAARVAETAARIVAAPDEREIAIRRLRYFKAEQAVLDWPAPSTPVLRQRGVYLIVGGLGGIGMALAEWLAGHHQARLVLVARSAPNAEQARRIEAWRARGAEGICVQADVTDLAAMCAAVRTAKARFGRIDGVVHSALSLGDAILDRMEPAEFRRVAASKIAGSFVLEQATRDEPLDFFVMFSSMSGVQGTPGQSNYAAGSTFQDHFAWSLAQRGRPAKVIDWGFWKNIGIVANETQRQRFAKLGVYGIETQEGIELFAHALGMPTVQLQVTRVAERVLATAKIDLAERWHLLPASAGPASSAVESAGVLHGLGADAQALATPAWQAEIEQLDRAYASLLDYTLHSVLGGLSRLADWPAGRAETPAELRRRFGIAHKYERWLAATLDFLATAGRVERVGDGFARSAAVPLPTAETIAHRRAACLEAFPTLRPHLALLDACCESYARVLTGRVDAATILFPQGSMAQVEGIYRGNPLVDYFNNLLATAVARAARELGKPVRVLEIGAGTGGSTRAILPALAATGAAIEYVYTDVAAAFLRHGEKQFGVHYPFMRFMRLDISRPPSEQGFVPGSFDVVVGTNVLHATPDLSDTLRHVKVLLRRHGLVFINELSFADAFSNATFGLTEGWWLDRDADWRMPHAPLATSEAWQGLLRVTGFDAVGAIAHPGGIQRQGLVYGRSDGLLKLRHDSTPKEAQAVPLVAVQAAPVGGAGRMLTYLRSTFAEVLKLQETPIDPDLTYEHYGLDSLTNMEIVSRLKDDLGSELPDTVLFEHNTLAALAAHLAPNFEARLAKLAVPNEQALVHDAFAQEVAPPPPIAANVAPAGRTEVDAEGSGDDVAVIGLACRYPGAEDVHAFWKLLREGRSAIGPVPAERWDHDALFDPGMHAATGKSYSRWGGFIEDYDRFDAPFFNINPRDAAQIDPQARVFLETAWAALENAGRTPASLGQEVGVFVGVMADEYALWAARHAGLAHAVGSGHWPIANLFSYAFNFRGPSLTVDTACSSSLTALHLACESLRRGECNAAIAGGVNLLLTPDRFVLYSANKMLAHDDKLKAFGEGGDGFVAAEGVGAVLLKPLRAALADGDRIVAVIKASGINSGGKTSGFTVPNPQAQAALVRQVLQRGGVDPGSIGYVEAHGTGTALGDPVEVAALTHAFGAGDRVGTCAIGSVKSNIGHLEAAAGIAGLIKVLLQMQHGELVPSLNAGQLNPKIDFAASPFRVQRELAPWPGVADGALLRACVSSFGAGGANAHAVLERRREPLPTSAADLGREPQIVLLSARDDERLREYAARWLGFLEEAAVPAPLCDIAFTSQVGRVEFEERAAILARDRGELLQALRELARGSVGANTLRDSTRRLRLQPALLSDERRAAIGAAVAGTDRETLARLWTEGHPVPWAQWHERQGHRDAKRMGLPSYPFARERHWLDEAGAATPAVAPGEMAPAEPVPALVRAIRDIDLRRGAIALLKERLGRAIKLPAERIDELDPIEKLGIDSMRALELVEELEGVFGTLSKTLFYEFPTLAVLAEHLVEAHRDTLVARIAPEPRRVPAALLSVPLPAHASAAPVARRAIASAASAATEALEPIAIVGMAGRYPRAADLQAFWNNLRDGLDCITEIPAERWDALARFSPQRGVRGKSYTKWGGFIDDVDKFDALFFRISPREAEVMDPQERVFLEAAWHAVEDAGYDPMRLGEASVGVFVGVMWGQYELWGAEETLRGNPQAPNSAYWSVANRVSYLLDLHGPSLAVDTACSSSLTTIHLACESLRRRECRQAIAGGVNLSLHPAKYGILSQAEFASSDGRCRSFGAGGDGYVPGEGVGALLLKPLSDAVAAGDRIHGVIRGSALNHGGRTNGYTVPSAAAQGDVIAQALARSGVDPRSISYIEAHGTGTALGDPIEIQGLSRAFRRHTDATQFCAIGSAKSNIGHLEAAAGVAGVTKVLLQFAHAQLAPSLHSQTPNPHIDFAASPFRLQRELGEWPAGDGAPRRAGVSSFGAGGANVHVLIEEYVEPVRPASDDAAGPQLFLFSAATEASLKDLVQRWTGHLAALALPDEAGNKPAQRLRFADMAYTSQVGRTPLSERLTVIADDVDDLLAKLQRFLTGDAGEAQVQYTSTAEAVALLDDDEEDQGYLQNLLRKRQWDKLAKWWRRGARIDWTSLYEGQGRRRAALPLYPFARERYWLPMERSAPASVAAVHPLLDRNISTYDQILFRKTLNGEAGLADQHRILERPVVPGAVLLEMVRAAHAAAAGESGSCIWRNVRFHRLLHTDQGAIDVDVALKPGESEVEFAVRSEGGAPYCDGRLLREAPVRRDRARLDIEAVKARCELHRRHDEIYAAFSERGLAYGPLLQGVRQLWANRDEALAEIELASGQDPALLLAPAVFDAALQAASGIVWSRDDIAEGLPALIGEIVLYGPLPPRCHAHVRLTSCDATSARFDLELLDDQGETLLAVRDLVVQGRPAPTRHQAPTTAVNLYRTDWQPLPAAATEASPAGRWWVCADAAWAAAVAEVLPPHKTVRIEAGEGYGKTPAGVLRIDPGEPAHWQRLLEETGAPDGVLYLWPCDTLPASTTHDIDAALRRGLYGCFHLLRALPRQQRVDIVIACREEREQPEQVAIGGFAASVRRENPRHLATVVQVEASEVSDAALLRRLIAERGGVHAEIVQRAGARLRRTLVPAQALQGTLRIRPQGAYLITGGLGGIGGKIARHLADRYQARLVLTGRSALDASRQRQLDEIEALGGQALYVVADSSDPQQLARALEKTHERFGPLHGVIHSAGLTRDSLLGDKPFEAFAAVLTPKVHGSYALDEATKNEPLDFFVLFSSIASLTGNAGQTDYAAANRFLDGFAVARNARVAQSVRSGRTIAIAWPHWQEGGMHISDELRQWQRQETGIESLATEPGCRAFVDIVGSGADYCAVLPGDAGKVARFISGRSAAPATPHAARTVQPGNAELELAVQEHVAGLLARELKIDRSRVGMKTALEQYGLDSIGMMAITRDLEGDLGELPKTLFFEHRSIDSLARHLVLEYRAALERKFQGAAPVSLDAAPVAAPAAVPRPAAPGGGNVAGAAEVAGVAAHQDIAIIGISGRYPDADNLDQFWRNLVEGRDSIVEVPPGRWDWRETFSTDRHASGKTYAKWGGFLDGHDCFDAPFFNVSAPEARQISPQERLFLETAWATLEDAGYRPSQLSGPVGVFVGCMWGGYDLCGADAARDSHKPPPSAAYWSIANRVSYVLDVRGPSYTVDSACSSSLTALHLACESIRRGESAAALAGGVNLSLHPSKYLQLGALGFASTDGRCRSFGEGGDGYVPGEGVGAVLLKPLAHAIRDGDHVHAVIKGSAVNHGGRTNGFTVPDPGAQAAVVREALQRAGIEPASIGYIEAHGTGTRLGDPIEIAGLTQAFGGKGDAGPVCAVGSVKSNIGHLEAAAGIAALAKVVLQMRHRMLVPSLHAERLNPHIDFARSPFYVQRHLQAWEPRQGPRRAGISSFGAGGANAHVVVEEFEPRIPAPVRADDEPQILVLSARSADRLQAYAQRLRDWLAAADVALPDVAFTLQTGRVPMAHRLAVIATSRADLIAGLDAYLEDRPLQGVRTGRGGTTEDEASAVPDEVLRAWVAAGEFNAIAGAWVVGQHIDWTAVHPNPRRRVPLPTYPFAAQRHWLAGTAAAAPTDQEALASLLERLSNRQIGVDEALSRFQADEVLSRLSRLSRDNH